MSQLESSEITVWDRIISDSKDTLKRVEAKAQKPRANIATLEEAKETGEPCPLAQSDSQKTESATQC
jgi:hypothetical protein